MTGQTFLWHGSSWPRSKLEPGADGGIHVGTREQATMRSPAFLHKIAITLRQGATRKSRDRGGDWAGRIADARRLGMDAICYLNRYEGLMPDVVERINARDLDRLPDYLFQRAVPEAEPSLIMLHPEDVRVVEIEPGPGHISLFHTCSAEKADRLLSAGTPGGVRMKLCSDPEAVWHSGGGEDEVTILSARVPARSLRPNPNWHAGDWLEIAKADHPWYFETEAALPPHAFRHVAGCRPRRRPAPDPLGAACAPKNAIMCRCPVDLR